MHSPILVAVGAVGSGLTRLFLDCYMPLLDYEDEIAEPEAVISGPIESKRRRKWGWLFLVIICTGAVLYLSQ